MDIHYTDDSETRIHILKMMYDSVEVVYKDILIVADGKLNKLINSKDDVLLSWGDDKTSEIKRFGTFFAMYDGTDTYKFQDIKVINIVTNQTKIFKGSRISDIQSFGDYMLAVDSGMYNIAKLVDINMDIAMEIESPVALHLSRTDGRYTWIGYRTYFNNKWHSVRINNNNYCIDIYDIIEFNADDTKSNYSLVGTEYIPSDKREKIRLSLNTLREKTGIEGVKYKLCLGGTLRGEAYNYIEPLNGANLGLFKTYNIANLGIKYGLISEDGTEILSGIFDEIEMYTKDTLIVQWNNKTYIYDIKQNKYVVGVDTEKFFRHSTLPICLFVNSQDNKLYVYDAFKRIYEYQEIFFMYESYRSTDYEYIIRMNINKNGSTPIYKYVDTKLTPITNMHVLSCCKASNWEPIVRNNVNTSTD